MQLAKSGQIQNVCGPNALMTITEYALDYGDKELQDKVDKLIDREIKNIEREDIRTLVLEKIDRIKKGERDLYL